MYKQGQQNGHVYYAERGAIYRAGKKNRHDKCKLSRADAQHESPHATRPRYINGKVRGCCFRGVRGGALRGRSLRRSR